MLDGPRAVDLDDLARLLADDQELIVRGIAGQCGQVGQCKDVREVERLHQGRVEEVNGLVRGRRPVGRGARGEVDPRLEDRLRAGLLHEDVVAGRGIVGDALEPDVADGGAELDRLDVGAMQSGTRDVGEEIHLAIPLLVGLICSGAILAQTNQPAIP